MSEKDAYYFSHDSNARNDIKMIRLRRKMGMAGVGLFWCIIEMLRESVDHKLPVSHIDDIAYDLGCLPEQITELISDFDLFCFDGECFFSNRLLRSMQTYKSISDKRSEIGRKGGQASAATRASKKGSKQLLKQRLSKGEPNVNVCSTIKGKESKVNKKEEKKVREKATAFIPPSLQEVQDYFKENGYDPDKGRAAFYHYEGNSWKDKNEKQVKNWKSKMQSVWFREENKVQVTKPAQPVITPPSHRNGNDLLSKYS